MYLTQVEKIVQKAVNSEVIARCRVIISQNEQLTKDNKMLMEQVSRLNNRIRDLHEELSEQVAELDKEI